MCRKSHIGFGAAVAVLAVAGLVSILSLHAYERADRVRDHTLEVLGAIDQVLQVAADAETSTRGFVITGAEAFLEPGRNTSRSAPVAMAQLRRLTADSPAQRERTIRLDSLLERKLAWTGQVAEARRAGGFESARALIASAQGKQLMDGMRRLCREMSAEELALLTERNAAVARNGRVAELVAILGSALALLLIAGATAVNRRERSQRRAAEDALRRAHDELEVHVQERTAQLTQANRSLRMLRECNQVLVRVVDEASLLDQICRIVVGVGGYRMSWIGLAEHDERKTIRSVAQAGFEEGYLASVDIVWADTERGRSPIGAAIRSGRPVVSQDIFADPHFAPWREEAAKRGYASIAALPLVAEGAVFGALAIYSSRQAAFDEDEMRLLLELSEDLAFGLRTLRLRSERDEMQAQLVQADRLVSVGTLAAGVAHEINNPLAYVIANLQYALPGLRKLAAELPPGRLHELEAALAAVCEGAERIRHTAGDLKTFSRIDGSRFGCVDVHRILDSSARMAHTEIRYRARLVKDYGATPLLRANDGRLGQVFLNLIVNAAHAIEEGAPDRNEIRLRTGTDAAGRVVVEVRDTGAGIPPENLRRIFDPFFTTKPIGIGTGLGLFICKNIVCGLGGELTVQSEAGRGSVFRVALPPAAEGTAAEEPRAAPVARGRRGRVMVVDDEAAIAESIRRLLAEDHDVVTFASARQAYERLVLGDRFDVILCDLMMPEMTGMELHAELVRIAPAQADRMVLLTGGAFTARARDFLQQVANRRIAKPFDAQEIRAAVRDFVG